MNRREVISVLLSTATIPLMSACAQNHDAATTGSSGDADAQRVLNDVGENLLKAFPEVATQLGLDTGARAGLRSELQNRSTNGRKQIAEMVRADLDRVNKIDTTKLSHATRTSVDVVKSAYATALDGFAFPFGDTTVGNWRNTPYTVIQNVGAYLDIPKALDADHRIENSADAEAYITRLQSYAKQLDGETERLQAARALGVVPPSFLLDKTLKQIQLSVTGARDGGSLVESIERRTKTIPGNWAERARTIAKQEVAPALDRQIAELRAERKVAKDEAGIWARPGGEDFYRWALHASTTTTKSPDEIHETGQRELDELHARMDEILKKLGLTSGSVGERMQGLAKDPKYHFPDNDAGRAEIMDFLHARLDWVRAQTPRMFKTVVNPNMEVKRMTPEEEPGAPAAYGGAGSIDGKVPGRFWINLRTTSLHSKYSLPDLAFHEAIPGHVWQGEYTHNMPIARQVLAFNAYSEGWALYAEQLADEFGAYDNDLVGRLGYLQSIAFRACRLVVDTGIHAKQWTRDQGVKFFVDVNGSNPLEVASEVDRYCAWPGQACGYKVGHSEILNQRAIAMKTLGSKYDIKAFNDALLLGGNVPLDVLATNVNEYVRSV
jgi:uncharacterized protein (DUF885 family)